MILLGSNLLVLKACAWKSIRYLLNVYGKLDSRNSFLKVAGQGFRVNGLSDGSSHDRMSNSKGTARAIGIRYKTVPLLVIQYDGGSKSGRLPRLPRLELYRNNLHLTGRLNY